MWGRAVAQSIFDAAALVFCANQPCTLKEQCSNNGAGYLIRAKGLIPAVLGNALRRGC